MKKITGSYNAQYFYSSNGNRLKAIRNGTTTYYIHDINGNVIAEADINKNITRYYVYGSGLIAMITPSGQIYNYHFNPIGSTVAMTDHNQNIINKYSYDEFGNILNKVEAASQPFKYVGQYGVMHEANGFYYMRARYYDPRVGRFISEDPIDFEGGDTNLSRYVGNNVINWIDPLGLWNPGIPQRNQYKNECDFLKALEKRILEQIQSERELIEWLRRQGVRDDNHQIRGLQYSIRSSERHLTVLRRMIKEKCDKKCK